MAKPNVLILKEHGTNCEYESKYAFEQVGAKADIVHMEDLIRNKKILDNYQVMMFPGGFSYGDDTGSGMAWANRIRNNLYKEMKDFSEKDHLILGVCNGFQTLANSGLLPKISNYTQQTALTHNESARYYVRWVDLKVQNSSPWLKGIESFMVPIAHGEGRFYTDKNVLEKLYKDNMIALKYFKGEICNHQDLEANPNGSLDDIAGITDKTGRILGMMPHPERATEFTQLPHWTLLKEKLSRNNEKVPEHGPGLQLLINAVKYFE